MDDDDSDRYAEIMRRTAKPKMRHIVLPSWVEECVDEETLMNEDGRSIPGSFAICTFLGLRHRNFARQEDGETQWAGSG